MALYLPMAQSSQDICAVTGWMVPAEQSSHCVWPAMALNLPVAQSSQDVCAVAGWTVPAEQSVHAAEPVELSDLPTALMSEPHPDFQVLNARKQV